MLRRGEDWGFKFEGNNFALRNAFSPSPTSSPTFPRWRSSPETRHGLRRTDILLRFIRQP
jgi:hypothetical protein